MNRSGLCLSVLVAVVVTSCNPFRQQAVQLDTENALLNERWYSRLTTPSGLEGALQVQGTAWMSPSEAEGQTDVFLQLTNAVPGGVHPWGIYQGSCGDEGSLLGSVDAYQPLSIDDDGEASASTQLSMAMPRNGNFFVKVMASLSNQETTIACGNMAPPTP